MELLEVKSKFNSLGFTAPELELILPTEVVFSTRVKQDTCSIEDKGLL